VKGFWITFVFLTVAFAKSYSQGTITFDGPPTFIGGILVDQYDEAGMSVLAVTNVQNYGGSAGFIAS